jgi:hypothetical protein
VLLDATRPILVNGIEEIATRGDLLDRAVILHLPAIDEANRQPEAVFWEDFRKTRAQILGGLLDALVRSLAILPDVRLRTLPRMADFVRFGVATEQALGWPSGAFLSAYGANRDAVQELTLEASSVGGPLREFVRRTGDWTGAATDLLDALTQLVDERILRRREWPKTPTTLGGQLRRLAPTLRNLGVDIAFHRAARHRYLTIRRVDRPARASSASSPSSAP